MQLDQNIVTTMSVHYECVDWVATLSKYGITKQTPGYGHKKVVCTCALCGDCFEAKYYSLKRRSYPWCNRCIKAESRQKISESLKIALASQTTREQMSQRSKSILSTSEARDKMRDAAKYSWDMTDRRAKQKARLSSREAREKLRIQSLKSLEDPQVLKNRSNASKRIMSNPVVREKLRVKMRLLYQDEAFKEKCRLATIDAMNSPEVRARISAVSKRNWKNSEYRTKALTMMANLPKVSNLAETFYSILDDLGVKYYREYNDREDDIECRIGPYSVDCVIPRDGRPALVVEINGDWVHSQQRRIDADIRKASYITNNFPNQYELKVLWEHEFHCRDKVVETLKYWLGTETELVDYDFGDLQIRTAPASDCKLLLSKYHYIPNAGRGRGGLVLGAYLNDDIIAVCVFSPPVRQNVRTNGYKISEIRELSRLCIHPKYRKKNMLSWFIKRCLKMLNKKIKLIIAYSDTTYNHTGAIYKACNFILDREVPPDYWYISNDGWVMHKKTLYNQAVNLHLTERQFAEKYNYRKVWGNKKLRFSYKL
jgi:hypothetical protein